MYQRALKTAAIGSAFLLMAAGSASASDEGEISFDMVVSAGAKTCLPDAKAKVRIMSTGTAEDLHIHATGLPLNTDFDFFVIQVPKTPFGLAWYQGDVQTNDKGVGNQYFRGRFNI